MRGAFRSADANAVMRATPQRFNTHNNVNPKIRMKPPTAPMAPASVGVEPWRAVLFGPMADQPSGGGSCARGRRERWGFLALLALVLVGFGLFLVLR